MSPAGAPYAWALAVIASGSCGQAQQVREWPRPAQAMTAASAPLSTAARRGMIAVPAGRYPIGRDSGPASQRPRHVQSLGGFRIDRTEVTNAAFAEYLNALRLPVRGRFDVGRISTANGDAAAIRLLTTRRSGEAHRPLIELDDDEARIIMMNGRFAPLRGHRDHPVTEVTWTGARGYCRWRGGDLPTEIQWEAAARGRDDRLFPWGSSPLGRDRLAAGRPVGGTSPVGSRPAGASPFGVLDMAGSLAEWTRSLKRPYPYRSGDGRESPSEPGERTTRGGDYEYDDRPVNFSVSFRDGFSNDPVHGHRHIGFRCVSATEPA